MSVPSVNNYAGFGFITTIFGGPFCLFIGNFWTKNIRLLGSMGVCKGGFGGGGELPRY